VSFIVFLLGLGFSRVSRVRVSVRITVNLVLVIARVGIELPDVE